MTPHPDPQASPEDDERAVLERCIEALDRGDSTAIDRLCAERPELAVSLRAQLDDLRHLRRRQPLAGTEQLRQIGRYRVLEVLGEGGMGTVYLAEQREPVRRRVAVKVVKLGMDSRQVLARFEAERQALALMNHDAIARVFDAGTTERGQPFFVMEHVPGAPLTEHCDRCRLTLRQRLALFVQVCSGVQHAHQKGVVHRDLKPSNVLVTVGQGRDVPKIIDFGLARATDSRLVEATLFTQQGQIVGTPAYMSPEQADPGAVDIDTRTDIYSLGVMLYELLVGQLPFPVRDAPLVGLTEMQRRIREDEPPRPSSRLHRLADATAQIAEQRQTTVATLARDLRGDLDWIVMRAIEKDRNRRYATASALADDLERFLRDDPVEARPPSAGYRLRKFVRRYRGRVAAVAALTIALLAGGLTSAIGFWRAERQAHIAWLTNAVVEHMFESADPRYARGEEITLVEILDDTVARLERDPSPDAEVDGWIRRLIGDAYARLGRYDLGVEHLRRAVAQLRQALGERHPRTLRAINDLGNALAGAGEPQEAEGYLRQAAAVGAEVLGADDRATLQSQHNLANTLQQQGEVDAAEELHRDVLRRREETFGADDDDSLQSLGSLGAVLIARGRYEEAETLCRRAAAGAAARLGDDHPETLIMRTNLAVLLHQRGRLDEAEQLLRDVLARKKRVQSEDHPLSLRAGGSLVQVLFDRGRFDEAESLLRDVLERQRRVLGEDDADTLASIDVLGRLLEKRGDLDGAETAYRQALAGRRARLGETHTATLTSMNNLGVLLTTRGRLDEAEPLLRAVLDARRQGFGEVHPKTLTAMNNLARLQSRRGQLDDAERLYRRTLDLRRQVLGDDHARTLNSMRNLIALLERRGRLDEAEELARGAATTWHRTGRGDHPDAIYADGQLARILMLQEGGLQEAEALLRSAIAVAERALAPDDRQRPTQRAMLGHCLLLQQRYDEAERELTQALESLRASMGEDSRWTRAATADLEELRAARDRR